MASVPNQLAKAAIDERVGEIANANESDKIQARAGEISTRELVRRERSVSAVFTAPGLRRPAPIAGEGVTLDVRADKLVDDRGVIHFAVPAAHWWNDILFTKATILYFRSEEHVRRWCREHGREMSVASSLW